MSESRFATSAVTSQDVPIGQNVSIADELAALRAENAALRANAGRKATSNGIKVSPKGALSVYGLGRFPVTLYRGQWERLFGMAEEIKGFITAHSDDLSVKE